MSYLDSRLRALFSERSVRRLAPASLLAVGSGVALGGLLVAPGFASAGAGIILGGIAVNVAE